VSLQIAENRRACALGVSPLAGKPAPKFMLIDVGRLEGDYFARWRGVSDPSQMVSFGTGGHRGSPIDGAFTEAYILAITQAICDYRRANGPDGPLCLGKDTHAVSKPTLQTAPEVLAANAEETLIQRDNGYTPTPAISRATFAYNPGHKAHFADGIAIARSHNTPNDGGFKYNPPNGGPADTDVTQWVENRADELPRGRNAVVKRMPFASAVNRPTAYQETFFCHMSATCET